MTNTIIQVIKAMKLNRTSQWMMAIKLMALGLFWATTAAAEGGTDTAVSAGTAVASTVPPEHQGAYALVESTTDDLLALIESAKTYIDEDEERFYTELEALLGPFVDFPAFARAVMGKHASGKKMASLDAAGQAQLEQQIQRFSDVFSRALIATYGKGLLAFEGERIEVVRPAELRAAERADRASIKQHIYGDRKQPYEIWYSMRRYPDDQWKLRNLIIESINLGKIYRNQFDNAFLVYEGDIDRVIDNWSVATPTE